MDDSIATPKLTSTYCRDSNISKERDQVTDYTTFEGYWGKT